MPKQTGKHSSRSKPPPQSGPRARVVGRRAVLRYGLIGAGAAAVGGGLYLGWPRREPTFIVVVIDTVRRDALGCYGNPRRLSPALDALAAEGVRFDQAVSTSGWTLPSIVSLLTGTWPTLHGAVGKKGTLTAIREEVFTAAEFFKLHGYNTLGWANCAFLSPMLGVKRGFDVYDCRHAYNQSIRRADETVAAMLVELESRRGQKNFVFLHLFDPHLDYDPPPGYAARLTGGRQEPPLPLGWQACHDFEREGGARPPIQADIDYVKAAYYGEINFVDDQIAHLVHALKDQELYDDCTLVVLADHGEEFWDHGEFEHGHTLYDELIHIPLIIKPPRGLARAGLAVPAQVRIIDIMPTLLEIAGIDSPVSFEGASLLPHLQGRPQPDRPALSESTLYGSEKLAWRTGTHKYIFDTDAQASPRIRVYDLRADPGEQHNLAAVQPELVAALRTRFEDFFARLRQRADDMSVPSVADMGPDHIQSLKSLGYIR